MWGLQVEEFGLFCFPQAAWMDVSAIRAACGYLSGRERARTSEPHGCEPCDPKPIPQGRTDRYFYYPCALSAIYP